MSKSFSYPVYRVETVDDRTVIAGPSTDCTRMNTAAQAFQGFSGRETRTVWVETLSVQEVRLFQGTTN